VAEGSEASLKALRSAAAELHTLAGWCAYDLHLTDLATWHYARAIKLAGDAEDAMAAVSAAYHQAVGWRELGAPNDALKLWQLALGKLDDVRDGTPGKANQQVWLHFGAADAFADLGHPEDARERQQRASRLPALTDPFEVADASHTRAGLELAIGRLDVAEQYASTAVGAFGTADQRDAAPAVIRLAAINAIAGEPKTERLAQQAIAAVAAVPSMRARAMLLPLEQALAGRKDSTSVELAQRCRMLRLKG
jgi:tetratricopeptide (TPR) repeat protein